MTPENQPEKGLAKKAYGAIKAGGHSLKRIGFGDIYALIDEKADEAREHREENFRYLNNKVDTQTGEIRQEIGQVRQEIGAVNQRIDTLGQKVDNRMDTLDQKIDAHTGQLRQEMGQIRQEFSQRLDTIMQMLVEVLKQKSQ